MFIALLSHGFSVSLPDLKPRWRKTAEEAFQETGHNTPIGESVDSLGTLRLGSDVLI